MKTELVTPQQLDRFERMDIAFNCKNGEFVVVRHDRNTIYFNSNLPAAAQLENLFLDMLTADLLDAPTATGAIPLDILATVEQITNPDAAHMLCSIWSEERDKRKKADNEAKAIKWRGENPIPEELAEMDTEFFNAIYYTVKKCEDKSPAQKVIAEHSHNAALRALFYYGYQCGTGSRPGSQQPLTPCR